MTEFDYVEVSYRIEHPWDLVVREIITNEGEHVDEISASSAHETLMKVREAVEDHELNVGRVERVILGGDEYEQVLAHGIIQKSPSGAVTFGRNQGDNELDPQEVVEDLVKKDVTVVPSSGIQPVGSPNDQLIQNLREGVDDAVND